MDSSIGGRFLICKPGTYLYDSDVYRGQRRRPWFSIRIGQTSPEMKDELFLLFIDKVHSYFIKKGILLDNDYLVRRPDFEDNISDLEDCRLLLKDILEKRDEKYLVGIMSVPIGLVVCDFSDGSIADKVISYYAEHANICLFNASDIITALINSDFSEIFKFCDEFIDSIVQGENIPQSIAEKKPVKKLQEFGATPVVFNTNFSPRSHEKSRRPSSSQNWKVQPHKPSNSKQYKMNSNISQPPGLNLSTNHCSVQQPSQDFPPGLYPPGLSPSSSCGKSLTPPGLELPKPPGIQRRNDIEDFDESESDESVNVPGPQRSISPTRELCTIRDILEKRNQVLDRPLIGEPRKTNNLMANDIAKPILFNRFGTPFRSAEDNVDFLIVINYACSSTNPDARKNIERIMSSCFTQRYPENIVVRFIEPCAFNGEHLDIDSVELIFELGFLFNYLCRLRPTINENMSECWKRYWESCKRFEPIDYFNANGKIEREDFDAHDNLCYAINKYMNKTKHGRNDDEMKRRREEEHYEKRRREEEIRRQNIENEERRREREEEQERYRETENARYENEQYYRRDQNCHASSSSSQHYADQNQGYDEVDQRSFQQKSVNQQQMVPISASNTSSNTNKQFVDNCRNINEESENNGYNIWKKCEKIEPPSDFRDMSELPTLKDYFHPEEPYLRRICDDGKYKDVQHYLDIQYRLMREDLISPLRDGIDIYKQNGTSRDHRIPNVLNSDLIIYRVDRIEGKQASPKDGFEMRYCHISSQTALQIMNEGKGFRGGNIVLFSSDGFVNEMHLAILNDLKDGKCISIIIVEEMKERPIELNKPYLMAEANSYLPAYKFVLKNLQKVNKFIPIPFQRYLLKPQNDIFRPAYQRQEKSENQLKFEKTLEDQFNEVRSIAVAKRINNGKNVEQKKKRKRSRSRRRRRKTRNWDEDFSDEDFRKDCEESESCDGSDEELYWLEKPIIKSPIGYLTSEEGNKIQIDGKWYHISNLLSEFFPKYMDDSQRVAFCSSFQRELSIIQGPPGTGKTHIGVEIVKTALKNRQHWRMTEPILIVCYTNSAIDQFLERIYMMIMSDEELSKDDGKPKIIRFGSKSESQIISKRRLLRENVVADYRNGSATDQSLVDDANSAYKDRNHREAELATSSYGLYASRKDLLSFTMLNRAMLPCFHQELRNWASTHVDTKNNTLSVDEALACWLLNIEFGHSTNVPKMNSKYSNLVVEQTRHHDEDYSDSDDEELTNEQILDKMFRKININCTVSDLNSQHNECENDGYHSETPWDIAVNTARDVVLLHSSMKVVGNNRSIPVDSEIVDRIREEKSMILKTAAMKQEEVEDVKFMFSLTRPARWALYQYWCNDLRKKLCEIIPHSIESYKASCLKIKKCNEKLDASISKSAMILGCTTSGCSRLRPMLERVKPKILVVEEAAEVFESHMLSAMVPSIEHTIMIGDHQQLRPNPSVHVLGREYGMDISMFERLIERGLPYSQLKEQHRMNTNIADLIVRPGFYPNVYDSESVKEYPPVDGFEHNLYFWSHCEKEETHDGVSWYNIYEVNMVISLVQHLLKQNYTRNDITIITTYSAQRNELLMSLSKVFGGSFDEPIIPVETVDSFQGQENKIVIVSLVRSHRGITENTGIGFLAVENRICVALTRAKHGMYIVGNGAYIANSSKLWSKITDNLIPKNMIGYHIDIKCTTHGNIQKIEKPSDFDTFSPEGGCSEKCDIQKMCGHKCQKKCHPNVESIHLQPCYYECQKSCKNNHSCKKKCYEDCGNCMEYIEKKMDCGHIVITPCFSFESAVCDQKCLKKLEGCGHNCMNKCGEKCMEEKDCKELIEEELKCGHRKMIECYHHKTNDNFECVEKCDRKMLGCNHRCPELCGKMCPLQCNEFVDTKLSCGHYLAIKCHNISKNGEFDEDLFECITLVRKRLEPCNHEMNIRCNDKPITIYCNYVCREKLEKCGHECGDVCSTCFTSGSHNCQKQCPKVLDCGHSCTSKCGSKCEACQSFCENACSHMSCGIQNKGYGRECRKLCVLCTNNCQNKCIHRSCDQKCFEECRIPICSEVCKMALKCGHGCLGMCGEICPNICGTCNRKGYSDIVECIENKENAKLYRLIQLRNCGHIFPVQFLDDYVESKKASMSPLICPRNGCSKQFGEVWRYAAYSKKVVLEQNKTKLRKMTINRDPDDEIKSMRTMVESMITSMRKSEKHSQGTSKAVKSICSSFYNWLINDYVKLIYGCNRDIVNTEFYRQTSIYITGLVYIFNSVLLVRINKKKKDYPPTVEQLLLDVFSDCDMFQRQMNAINEVLVELRKVIQFGFLGAVIPKLRFSLARSNCVLQLMVLCRYLKMNETDMSVQFANALKANCIALFERSEKTDLVGCCEIIEKMIISQYPTIERIDGFKKWVSYGFPDF